MLAIAGLCLAAALLVLTARPRTEPVSTEDAALMAQSRAAIEKRIRYPEAQYPKLTLPDGQQQTIRSVLNIRRKMRFGDYVWNEDHIPEGQVWVRIDLAHQLLSVFRGGHEIGSAVILYGTDGKPTPTGLFTVLAKAEHYHSQTYDSPMPYMLRLTADGVAIHASDVREGWATHGCIGIPDSFARRLFGQMQVGDLVVIVPANA